jgi:DNA-binding IclR family transcriptional regulator
MERDEVSLHEVAIYKALCSANDAWLTSAELAIRAKVAPRTARAHALKLTRLGVVDRAPVFPGHRYRIAEHTAERGSDYVARLRHTASVLGIDLTTSNGKHAKGEAYA